MKPTKGGVSPNQSCSCTSCLYRSESDRPSLRRIIAQGSKIDKLYYGKYIPLRERKLLGKLVRTRAVYDDIRNELLSSSNISVAQANLKPRKKEPIIKPDKGGQKGGDIPALVDLVDKGNVLIPDNSSECCSCCICGSKLSLHEESPKTHIHKHRRRAGAQMTSKSSVISRHRAGEEIRMGKAVHFKTKHIRSDPCTCTYKFREMVKRQSKSVLKKFRHNKPDPVLEPRAGAAEQSKPKKKKTAKKTIEKVKQSKTRLVKGMQESARKSATKIKETKARVKENVEAVAKKSFEIIRETKQKVQEKIASRKQIPEEPVVLKSYEANEEKSFNIRKDSLTKFREKLRKKRQLKDWECDFECSPQECVPEECFRIITRKRLRRIKQTSARESISVEKRERKTGAKSKVSDVIIQAYKTQKPIQRQSRRKIETEKKKKRDTSCVCVEIKKKDVKDTKERGTMPDKKTSETKSVTSLTRKQSKSPEQTVPVVPVTKVETNNLKESVSGVKVERARTPKQIENKLREERMHPRQAVRVGSTISFNIEFYKEKPRIGTSEVKSRKEVSSLIKERQQRLKTKENHSLVKNVRRKNKGSETIVKLSGKNIQAVAHPLKRCFCTLKLKPRKTKTTVNVDKSTNIKCACPYTTAAIGERESVTESIQTKKMPEPGYTLEPYECEPGQCVPGECDPIECDKRIRKRNKKYHSVSINTAQQMKSSSSITVKSVSSSASRGLQVQTVHKPKHRPQREPSIKSSIAPALKNSSSQRQTVRIGSTFSFQIEFSRGGISTAAPVINDTVLNKYNSFRPDQKSIKKPRKEKGVPSAKQYIKHKYSQISTSTKNKLTSQKHKLKRCFCTLKMNKLDKKKVKIISTSKGTVTSSQMNNFKPKAAVKSVSMETKKNKKFVVKPRLLPYECEPGVCIPGKCDPYECLELLKIREIQESQTKTKTSNTDYRKTKSTSSFAPKLIKHARTKQVQSTLVTHKDKAPSSTMTKNMPQPRKVLNLPNNLNRQAVRIGSSFSFNIEFYKYHPVKGEPIMYYRSSPKNLINPERKQVAQRTRGQQDTFVTQRKSVTMQAERKQKNVPISTAMKRCFCTLKLQKPTKNFIKDVNTIGTKTPKFKNKQQKFETVATNKRMKRYQNMLLQLEPYECEPHVCTPGDCDPYKCLERIKERNKKLYSREIGVRAKPSKMMSTSSSVQIVGNARKNAIVQSKALKQKTKKIKEKHTTFEKVQKIPKGYTEKQSRQSVRLGSSFSFDLEFGKTQKSDENQIVQTPREHGDVQHSKLYKHQGDQSFRAALHQHKSQADVIKKAHKGTRVAPILKRCFCTLQLQNKRNHPKNTAQVYTVSTVGVTKPVFIQNTLANAKAESVMTPINIEDSHNIEQLSNTNAVVDYSSGTVISNVFSYSTMHIDSILVQPYLLNNHNHYIYSKSISGPIPSQPILRINSKLKCTKSSMTQPKAARSLCTKNPSSRHRVKKISEINVIKYYDSYTSKIKQPKNEMSAYLSRQFCAMNLQVPNKYRSPNKHKLDPYECEPGFCVPYECDPLVCKERIMKRLMKNASKSSGTQNQLHSASSSTLNTPYRSKRLQSIASSEPGRRLHKQSPSLKSHEKGFAGSQRQAVRVGSNFSFNIEFSKDKMQPLVAKETAHYTPPSTRRYRKPTEKMRHRGTREYSRPGRDQDSQSMVEMAHRGSNATPLLKRCFCTLKLHKKGRQEKSFSSTEDKGVAFNNDIVTIQTADSTQNTERQTYRKLRHNLEPYECEPGICVPGECNPYECLELIKKRKQKGKDFGTNSIKFGRMSTSSMTPSQKIRTKNRRNQLNLKEKRQHVSPYKPSVQSLGSPKPSRQAVRIGSSFSFNVEFFKENPNVIQSTPSVTSEKIKHTPHREKRKSRRTRDLKDRFSQNDRAVLHKDSQSDFMQHMKSTMTSSFIKRCFCTAKLYKQEKTTAQVEHKTVNVNVEPIKSTNSKPSFLQRCLCVMKSLTAAKVKSGTLSQTEQKIVLKHQVPVQQLLPYECEPGVCVPGECDPYVCEQLIKKRNAKLGTKLTSTTRPRTKSQSSSFQSYGSARAKQTQMNLNTNSRVVKPKSSVGFDRGEKLKYSSSPGRQAVRVGSSFNFNIEFYKENPTVGTIKDKPPTDHRPKRWQMSEDSKKHRPKTKSRGSFERRKLKQSRESQVQSIQKQDRASGVGQFLQRCFCTLNLRKPKVSKSYTETGTQSKRKRVAKEPSNRDTKSVMRTINKSIPYKLEPYECEPNTCIPGECDPYECEKRIKRRLRREHGTSTIRSKTKSATSMASSARKIKNTKVQSRSKKTHSHRTDIERTRISKSKKLDRPSKQAVRIRSTFSFSIDFFKENADSPHIRHTTKSKVRHKDVGDYDSNHKRRSSVPCETNTFQAKKRMRDVDSQVLAKKMRSTMTGVAPLLKRCFCTLKLQKPNTRAQQERSNDQTQPKIEMDNKSTYTSKKLYKPPAPMRTHQLDPYECEPGVCVPGQCDPYECEKRIKMRDIGRHSVSSNTDKSRDSSKTVSAKTGHKGKKSQAITLSHERKKHKTATSNKSRPLVRQPKIQSGHSPRRQAVRIGSNFSFDIEFSKGACRNGATKEVFKSDEVSRVKDKPRLRTRSMGAGHRGISFYHRKSQAYAPKKETKGSGVGPLLKRCFCTLKLHKQGKQQKQPCVQMQVDYHPPPSSFDASTETMKTRRVLEPYECEPNVCVPGLCDPYECLRRIKRRQMKELGISTVRPSMMSDYSSTTKRHTKDKTLRTKDTKKRRPERNVSFHKEPQRKILISENTNRQAVRIGSSFKFDIEFYKQKSTPNDQGHGDGQDYKSTSLKETKQRPHITRARGSQSICPPRCKEVQMQSAQRESRGSGMAPLLKRCFCTLALQKTTKQHFSQKPMKPQEKITSKDMYTQSKSTFTKTKSLPYALEPYECEPNICVPGECDPNECYERIKKRNARYKSRGLSTDAKRYSQASSMTMGRGKYSKKTQSVLLGKRRPHHRSSSINQSMVVEQPRFSLLSDIANRNVVKIGSNISFNIEFYKEVAPALRGNYIDERRETKVKIEPKDTKDINTLKCNSYRDRESQAQSFKTQNKGSLVTNTLKRCFCTAQLHKTNTSRPKMDTSRKCIECNPKSTFGPQQYQVYYHKAFLKKPPVKTCVCTVCENKMCQRTKTTSTKSSRRFKLKRRSNTKSKTSKNESEMETILPYKANKFNRKTSKTLFSNNKAKIDKESKCCPTCKCNNLMCSKLDQNSIPKNRKLKSKKSTKKLNIENVKNPVPTGNGVTSSSKLINKSFLCRCKELFLKQIKPESNTNGTCPDVCTRANKSIKESELRMVEKLKKTKSERRPTKANRKEPKKTTSLKMNKCSEKDCYYEDADNNNPEFQSGDKKKSKRASKASKLEKNGITSEKNKKQICPHCGDYNPDLNQKLNKDIKKQVKFSDLKQLPTYSSPMECEVGCKTKSKSNRRSSKNVVPTNETNKPKSISKSRSKSSSKKNKNKDNIEFCPFCQDILSEEIKRASFKDNRKKSKSKHKINDQPLEEGDNPCSRGICKNTGASLKDSKKKSKSKPKIKYQPLEEGDNPCSRGICKNTGARLTIAAKGSQSAVPHGKNDVGQKIDSIKKNVEAINKARPNAMYKIVTEEQICACYSSICECAKAIRKQKEKAQRIELELKLQKRRLARKRKEAEKAAKKRHADFLARQRRYAHEDSIRRHKRSIKNKSLEHSVRATKAPDAILAADSVLDIAKLSCTVLGDIARSTCRFVIDPVYSCKKLKTAVTHPASTIKNVVEDTGLIATLKRVYMRVSAMKGIQAARTALEANQFTGYLLKMAEDDPRKRIVKKKPVKKPTENMDDFECSLYMNSLRKKRFLSVYYLCPWFYPHFITLLNLVGQVTDLLLFLVAVFVWSPCILCMELCRAFVCCFLCTG